MGDITDDLIIVITVTTILPHLCGWAIPFRVVLRPPMAAIQSVSYITWLASVRVSNMNPAISAVAPRLVQTALRLHSASARSPK